MNKTLLISFLACVLFAGAVCAQNAADEKKILTAKAFALFQKGKLDDAIAAAEKVVALEKNSNQMDASSYANALVNLARMKRERFLALQNKARDAMPSERNDLRRKSLADIKDSEELFREALRLNEASGGRRQTAQTADIKSDLAWTAMNYTPVPNGDAPSIANTRARIDDAERFFAESLALNEQTRGRDADETLAVVLGMGNFYLKYDNYDKAYAFYERFVETAERTHGKNYPNLINALRPYAKILRATFQDAEAAEAVKRIEEITGKKEDAPKADLSLHLRSKDSVAFNAPNFIAVNEEMRKLRERVGRAVSRSDIESMPKLERVPVRVTVDETGKILEAVAETNNSKLREKAEREISKWTVRPFSYNGAARKLRGYLFYTEVR
jgi:tetratricopeptide (TPR) repeat protein